MPDAPRGGRDPGTDGSATQRDGTVGRDPGGPGQPTLSVCVPTYHRPVLLDRAIRSVIASAAGYEDDVEIVVSDNSPDATEDAARAALAAWPGQSQYHGNRPDVGLPGNLNRCLAMARGRYVAFVHDDDEFAPGAVPTILRTIKGTPDPDPVLFFGVDVVDPTGHVIRRQRFCREERIEPAAAVHRLLSDNSLAWFPGLVVRADAYAAAGPFDASVGNATDIDMWVRLFSRFGVRCVPGTTSRYTVHAGSATQSMSIDAAAIGHLADIFRRAEGTGVLPSETIRECLGRYVSQVILGATYVDLRAGNVASARQSLAAFRLPAVRHAGQPLVWRPVRWITALMARAPAPLVRPFVRLVDRAGVVRLVRSLGSRGAGQLPTC